MKALIHTVTLCLLLWSGCAIQAQDRSNWDENNWTDHLVYENRYRWKGQVRTPDGSYCDIVTPTHACEVDWSHKWAEGVGQALFYGIALEKKPGLILLVKDWKTDRKYYLRALSVCAKYEIKLIVVETRP